MMEIAVIILAAVTILLAVAYYKSAERNRQLSIDNARLQERVENLREDADVRQEQMEEHLRSMARELVHAGTQTISDESTRSMKSVLAPLRDDLDRFNRSVSECYQREARERFSLMKAVEQLVKTNNSLGAEARQLAHALRGDSKVQGDWGELVLETILEKSGLRRDEEYIVQATTDSSGNPLKTDDGHSARPDVVVRYPGGRVVVIDSKVSLTAYIEMVNAEAPAQRQDAMQRHIQSVRNHIRVLRDKDYQSIVGDNTTDFVMMFIPNESAYIAAMQGRPTLWQEAYDSRVLIVSPTHLVSALRLIAQLWRHDRQSRNAIEIATEAGKLYDKFAGFVADMEQIERSLTASRRAYDSAMNKLSNGNGNLMRRVENLRALGAKASKQLSIQDGEDA